MACSNITNWMDSATDIFTAICGVTTVFLNALVLYIALRYVDFHVKLSQIYVVNMSAADLLYGLFYMTTKGFLVLFPSWVCACYYMIIWTCQIGSVFFLLFLNIDKFISLSAPLHYNIYVSERCVKYQWMTFWIVPLTYSAFTYFGPFMTSPCAETPCKIRIEPMYYASMIVVFYVIPLLLSTMISIYIYVLAHKKTRWTVDIADSQAVERRRARKALFKRLFFVFSSTIWSAITILPYRSAYCIYAFACASPGAQEYSNGNFSSTPVPTDLASLAENTSIVDNLTDSNFSSFATTDYPLEDDDSDGSPSMCQSRTVEAVIYVFFGLLPLGAVGNPLITLVTQRFYRNRVGKIWTSWTDFVLRRHRIGHGHPDRDASVNGECSNKFGDSRSFSVKSDNFRATNRLTGKHLPLLNAHKLNRNAASDSELCETKVSQNATL